VRRSATLALPPYALEVIRATNLERKLGAVAKDLSHGEQQALELAMVLALEPRIVLLDEPTAGLTKTERTQIGNVLATLAHRYKLCCLLVEHDLDFVAGIATRIVVLHQGRIVMQGNFDEVVNSELVRTIYAGTAQGDAAAGAGDTTGGVVSQLALNLKDVTSGYKASVVLRKLSFSVANGEAVALLGKNGMGKTTLLKTIMGYLPKQSGAVHVHGQDITRLPPHRIARAGIAYAPQEHALFQDLSIRDNLRLGLVNVSVFDERFAEIEPIFPVFGSRLRQYAGTLSGGEQKMLLVARALMMRPSIILLDEITEGLQPSVIDRLADALLWERSRHGTTLLLIEQNVPFALKVADRYAVLKQGEIVDEGNAKDDAAAESIYEHLRV